MSIHIFPGNCCIKNGIRRGVKRGSLTHNVHYQIIRRVDCASTVPCYFILWYQHSMVPLCVVVRAYGKNHLCFKEPVPCKSTRTLKIYSQSRPLRNKKHACSKSGLSFHETAFPSGSLSEVSVRNYKTLAIRKRIFSSNYLIVLLYSAPGVMTIFQYSPEPLTKR